MIYDLEGEGAGHGPPGGLDSPAAEIGSVFPSLVVDPAARAAPLARLHRLARRVALCMRRPGLPGGRLQDLAPELL